jgi:hypothetical protein
MDDLAAIDGSDCGVDETKEKLSLPQGDGIAARWC